jgi:hypothetical protein
VTDGFAIRPFSRDLWREVDCRAGDDSEHGLGAAGLTEAAGIAWEAHLGGFYAGLLLYGLFDRPPAVESDVALAE